MTVVKLSGEYCCRSGPLLPAGLLITSCGSAKPAKVLHSMKPMPKLCILVLYPRLCIVLVSALHIVRCLQLCLRLYAFDQMTHAPLASSTSPYHVRPPLLCTNSSVLKCSFASIVLCDCNSSCFTRLTSVTLRPYLPPGIAIRLHLCSRDHVCCFVTVRYRACTWCAVALLGNAKKKCVQLPLALPSPIHVLTFSSPGNGVKLRI